MQSATRKLWAAQDRHRGDRQRLFTAVADTTWAANVLYPGSFVDLAPSFVWPRVTYVDMDRRAARFFDDAEGVGELIAEHGADAALHEARFFAADYRDELPFADESFDLLISLFTGPALDHVTRYLAPGGTLLANSSHGDVALASLDERYELIGAVEARAGDYRVTADGLDRFLVPKKPAQLSAEMIRNSGRGIAYTRSAFAYLFRRCA